jgi:predicted porin
MKKHLIALAVAGAVAAPAMAQNATIYGTIEQNLQNDSSATTHAEAFLATSVIGIKGSEDLGGGMKAEFALEMAFKAGSGTEATSGVLFDEQSMVGLSGGFGRAIFGRYSTVYDSYKSHANMGVNLFSDTDAVVNDLAVIPQGTLRYESPSINGFKVEASYSDDSTSTYANVSSFAVSYTVAGLALTYASAQDAGTNKEATVNATYAIGPVTLKGQLMSGKETTGEDVKVNKLGADYKFGANNLLISVQNKSSKKAASDEQAVGAMLVHNLSKRTALYAGFNNRGGDVDIKTTAIGVQHKF